MRYRIIYIILEAQADVLTRSCDRRWLCKVPCCFSPVMAICWSIELEPSEQIGTPRCQHCSRTVTFYGGVGTECVSVSSSLVLKTVTSLQIDGSIYPLHAEYPKDITSKSILVQQRKFRAHTMLFYRPCLVKRRSETLSTSY